MDDLYRLNRQIAMHWLGRLGPAEETYLSQVTVCLGQLNHRAADVLQHLNELKARGANSLRIGKLNRRYLRFARRAAQESCGNCAFRADSASHCALFCDDRKAYLRSLERSGGDLSRLL